jgi:hypothetical protein
MKLLIVIMLALVLLILVRRRLLQVDLSFPLFLSLIVLGFASMSDRFIHWTADILGITYPPIGIIFMAVAILLSLITILAVAYSRLRRRQIMILRHIAGADLTQQEKKMEATSHGVGPST